MEENGEKTKKTKRKVMAGIVRAVLKRNRMQAAALAITYTLTFALLVMIVFFYPSIETTFSRYLDLYRIPDATILTTVLPKARAEETIGRENGIRAFTTQTLLEAQTHFRNGKSVSCRYLSIPETDEERYYNVTRKEDARPDGNSVMISSYFARHNGIAAGDTFTVNTYLGEKKLTVTDIVSSPETINTNRDAYSWYDSNDFAYIFVGEPLMSELFASGGYCNRISLWFEEGTDAGQALSDIKGRLGSAVTYAATYEGSDAQKQLKDAFEGTKGLVTYLPVLMTGMGILFSTLFFIQIVNREEKHNGLLIAMGYDLRRISSIYVRCAIRLTLISSVFGFALGAVLLRVMLQIYVGNYDLPFVHYEGSLLSLPVLLLVIMLIGAASSLLSCLRLGKLDPAQIFSNVSAEQKGDLPGWVSRLRTNAFVKMSLCGIYRNRKRFCLSVLCGMACLVLTFLALSIIASKKESTRFLFGERYRYDLAVRADHEAALDQIASLPGVEQAETITVMDFAYEDETTVLEALPENPVMTGIMSADGKKLSVPSDGILLEEGFARRHGLSTGDVMTINGVNLTVRGIAREYYNCVQYVSFETAAALGSKEANTVLLTLADEQSAGGVISAAGTTAGYLYHFDRQSRQECFESVLSALDLPCYVFSLFSVVIGAVIVSTMNLVSIAQRRKKYAVLHVLGTSESDFVGMELPEAILQFISTVLLGTVPAILFTQYILRQMSVPSQEFVMVHPARTLLSASAVVAAYLLIGILVTIGAIRKMKYLEVLSEK